MPVIQTTDGKLIEVQEGVLRRPPPTTRPKKTKNRAYKAPLKATKPKTFGWQVRAPIVPGLAEWWSRRLSEIKRVSPNKQGRKLGHPDGMSLEEAREAWKLAKEKALIHMANIKKSGVVDVTSERAEKAMVATLEIMESPMNQDMKLKAARQVLEWTLPKAVAKSEVTVNAAEEWLKSIATETADDED